MIELFNVNDFKEDEEQEDLTFISEVSHIQEYVDHIRNITISEVY